MLMHTIEPNIVGNIELAYRNLPTINDLLEDDPSEKLDISLSESCSDWISELSNTVEEKLYVTEDFCNFYYDYDKSISENCVPLLVERYLEMNIYSSNTLFIFPYESPEVYYYFQSCKDKGISIKESHLYKLLIDIEDAINAISYCCEILFDEKFIETTPFVITISSESFGGFNYECLLSILRFRDFLLEYYQDKRKCY